MFVTAFDTFTVSLAAMFVWRISPFIVFLPWLTIASMDGAFLSAALTKVPAGAWFTITLATVLASLLLLWRFGKEQQWFAEAEDRFPTKHFVSTDTNSQLRLSEKYGSAPISKTRGLGIFFDKAGETTPIVFSQFILKLTSMPEVIVFFHLRPLETPSVAPEDRHTVSRLAIPNCYRLVVRYGYNDEIVTPNLASVVAEQIRRFLVSERGTNPTAVVADSPKSEKDGATFDYNPDQSRAGRQANGDRISTELAKLEEAYDHGIIYIIGKEQMKIKPKTNYLRSVLLGMFLWIRENSRNKMANLQVRADQLIEVGFLKEI